MIATTTDRMTPERVVSHSASVIIDGSPDDFPVIALGISRALAERYRYVIVPETFAVHSDGSTTCEWTWETKRPTEEEDWTK